MFFTQSQTPPGAARSKAVASGRMSGRQRGYTLVELLTVLAILGLVTAMTAPSVQRFLEEAQAETARLQIVNLTRALDLFHLDVGRYPTAREGLAALLEAPADRPGRWLGPYLDQPDLLVDPWGRPFVYRVPGTAGAYDLMSERLVSERRTDAAR